MIRPERKTNSARRARRRHLGVAIAVVVGAAALVGYFTYRAQADLPGQKLVDQGNRHVQTSADPHEPYNSVPPTSGPHLPYLAPWGIHSRPIPDELQVHNLEDGGVLLQYSCECPELVEQLARIVRRYDSHVILAPYPAMKSRIALTAWTRLDPLDGFDEARIERFIKAYRGLDHHPR